MFKSDIYDDELADYLHILNVLCLFMLDIQFGISEYCIKHLKDKVFHNARCNTVINQIIQLDTFK